jgi:tetratricopeptide (TPR) repeat protein
LQLCPVGPSSHVFLCNRAAALLSLKRYQAAAIDARRAVALAPTFGKAHARLGQALYFIKDYVGAVRAYEDALEYEPDNPVTRTYLEKAKNKLVRQQEKAMRMASRGGGDADGASLADESMPATVIHSVATDPHGSKAVIAPGGGFRGESAAIRNAVAKSPPTATIITTTTTIRSQATSPLTPENDNDPPPHHHTMPDDEDDDDRLFVLQDDEQQQEDDPDLEEAIRIQQRANQYLTLKNYKAAIEEYSAALFLVPDDPVLSPQLHLGRAHALNGSRRHESARHDAIMAIKLQATPEAYSTLAKTLFYLKDYAGAIHAFEECQQLLPPGAKLSMFDQAYLDKAHVALTEEAKDGGASVAGGGDDHRSISSKHSVVPKLPPPRFVPRQEVSNRMDWLVGWMNRCCC